MTYMYFFPIESIGKYIFPIENVVFSHFQLMVIFKE